MVAVSCVVCKANPNLQGAVLQMDDEAKTLHIVCGLHLNEDGTAVNEKEISGKPTVIKSWGYKSEGFGPSMAPEAQALQLFDDTYQRVLQNSQDGWGWKIVILRGDLCIEASTFPKTGGYSAPSPFKPVANQRQPATATGTPAQNIAQIEFWIKKGILAAPGAGFAYAHLTNKDRQEHPPATALKAAIETAGGTLTIDGYDYKMGGSQGTLINRTVAKK